jgi:hypothetical protein
MRALSELTFQVAMRTEPTVANYAPEPPRGRFAGGFGESAAFALVGFVGAGAAAADSALAAAAVAAALTTRFGAGADLGSAGVGETFGCLDVFKGFAAVVAVVAVLALLALVGFASAAFAVFAVFTVFAVFAIFAVFGASTAVGTGSVSTTAGVVVSACATLGFVIRGLATLGFAASGFAASGAAATVGALTALAGFEFLAPLGVFAGSTIDAIAGVARSMLRRGGAKLSTTNDTDSPIFMNSRALRGAGLLISRRGT